MNSRNLEYALGPLDAIGLGQPLLETYSTLTNRFDELEEIDPAIRDYHLPESEVKGEILLPFTHSQALTDHLYGFLGHTLRTRGYRPLLISCRGSLPLCLRKRDHPDVEGSCVNCRHKSDTILDAYGFEQIPLTKFASPASSIELPDDHSTLRSFSYHDVDVSSFAIATTRRYLRKYRIDLDDPNDRDVYERYLRSAISLVDFTYNIIKERDVVATVGNHPAYIYGGVFLAATVNRGLPAISYGGGYLRKDALLFGNQENRKGFELFSDMETLRERVRKPLTSSEQEKVQFYMEGRRDGSTIRSMNHYIQSAEEGLQLDTSKTVVGMFTNLLWDGSLADSAVTFEDPFDWVKQTLNFVADRDDLQLVIKPHPAEAHRETEVEMATWIRSEVDIPENVTVLDPDTDISPYELMQEIDLGIVYNSTVGLETAYEGVPVITTGDTHYKNLGFTYDPETREEYLELLKRASSLSMSDEERNLVERYAYFLLVERHITIDGLDSITEIHKVDHESIAESETLDRIVEQILSNERSPRTLIET